MPITKENKNRYPPFDVWKEIRARILERADNKCEFCKVPNHAMGYRKPCGCFVQIAPDQYVVKKAEGENVIRIVLTIMHLDHIPEHNSDDNLKAGCQRCHNRYDAAHRKENRKKTLTLKMRHGEIIERAKQMARRK